MTRPITIPLLNPNEPDALLAGLHVEEGQRVAAGDLICTLETTKSTHELHAERDGFVIGLRYQEGDTVTAGETLCYLASSPDWRPPAAAQSGEDGQESALPAGLRISKPALALARERQVDLSTLPAGPLITRERLESLLAGEREWRAPATEFDATQIVVYGGGGHGKAVIELLRVLGRYQIAGVVDDGDIGESVLGVPVLGGGEVLPELYAQGVRLAVNAVGGIGNRAARVRVFERIAQAGFACPAVVHPRAFVEASARLAAGVQVFPFAYVGSEARVGFGSIINTAAVVSHDCVLGDYTNLSPGATLAGEVRVGNGVLIGMGVTVNLGVRIGARAQIGNGATVKDDVPEGGIVRAGSIWPR